jgi:hypothetical protein
MKAALAAKGNLQAAEDAPADLTDALRAADDADDGDDEDDDS